MRIDTKFVLAISGAALLASLTPCNAIGQDKHASGRSENVSQMCMKGLWKALVPLIDTKHGYIAGADLERIAKIKLPAPIAVSPGDTISSLEWKAPYSLPSTVPGWPASSGNAELSLRLELHDETSPISRPHSWQRMQRRINGTQFSNLDLTCIGGFDTLTLREAEADLEAMGFERVGTLSKPQPVEVFYQDRKGRVDLYYDSPVETVPTVISVHVSGMSIAGR